MADVPASDSGEGDTPQPMELETEDRDKPDNNSQGKLIAFKL